MHTNAHPLVFTIALLTASMAFSASPAQAQEHEHHQHHQAHQVCRDVKVKNKPTDNHRIAGTAIGAVAGGLLGHQVGGGKGKTLATVGGAVAGGVVGNKVQEHHQDSHGHYHIEKRCHDVDD